MQDISPTSRIPSDCPGKILASPIQGARAGGAGRRLVLGMAMATLPLAAPAPLWAQDEDLPPDVRERTYLDLSATGVAASGDSFDANEDEDRSGGIVRAALGWDRDSGADHFDLRASTSYYVYTDDTRSDRNSNRLELGYGRDVSDKVRISVMARGATELSTLESDSADEARVLGRVAFEDGPHRVRLTGGWRWRDYNGAGLVHGDGAMAEIEYRHRLGPGTYILAEAVYDEISAVVPRLTYERYTLRAAAGIRVNKDVDVDIGVRWRDWENKYRLVGTESRTANSFAPEVGATYEFARRWYIQASGTLIWRSSNDPDYDRDVQRVSLTLRKRFWLQR